MMRRIRRFTALLLAGALGFPLGASPAADAKKPVQVFAATAAAGAVEEIGKAFSEASGVPVRVSSGGSPGLAKRILDGEPADLFIPAGFTTLAKLKPAGLVDDESIYLWTRGRLVVIASSQVGALSSPQEIADPRFRRLALATPGSVPLGTYARQSLTYYRLWDALEKRIVPLPDSLSVLTSVESGAADLGIVCASDALTSSRVKIVLEFPEESHSPIRYFVSLVAHPGASPAARPFLDFLKS